LPRAESAHTATDRFRDLGPVRPDGCPGDTSIVRIVGVARIVRDESDRPQSSQITLVPETPIGVGPG
jgi:hypothetical protein